MDTVAATTGPQSALSFELGFRHYYHAKIPSVALPRVLNNIVTFLKFYATLRLWETRRAYGVIFRSWRSGGC